MGTQLMFAGLEQGSCGEAWNLTHPDKVLAIQRRYAEAGSDCILTNTFGGSRIMLNRHGHADDVVAINQAAVAIAREAFGDRDGYVLGDIGPFGGLMEPYGDFTEAQVRDAFNEQAQALVDAGADAIIIETQTSLEELALGIEAAQGGRRAVRHRLDGLRRDARRLDLPHDDGHRSRARRRVHGGARRRHRRPQLRHGHGHGAGPRGGRSAIARVTDLPVMAQPNAGQPKLVNMKVVYDETPEEMVSGVVPLLEAGANIVGACCGSTPDHIRAFRRRSTPISPPLPAGTRA